MNYFKPTKNISRVDEALRVLTGAVLLLATPAAIASGAHPGILPMIAPYPTKPPARMHTCRGG